MFKANPKQSTSQKASKSGAKAKTFEPSPAKGAGSSPVKTSEDVERVNEIIKPPNDSREYRGLILPNEFRVLLISDQTTDKAAAAMSVRVGSLSDPWERQGLAHLVEHVLFLSSRKYPTDNFFRQYVTSRGGSTNACTLLTETQFYFDISPSYLPNALDRFASVFVSPLFPEDKIERELDSIQFEFESMFTDDCHRCERVRKQVGDPKHVYAKFELGNKTTLVKDSTLVPSVVDFYKTYYSANIMGLAVLGKESLDQLEKMVIPLFSKIANRHVVIPLCKEHPYSAEFCRKVVKIVPFKETRKMILFFPLPYTMKSNALDYITWLLSHEGPGGLLAELKARGLCTSIAIHSPYHHGFAFLDIEVDLTQGINGNDQIVHTVFQYLAMLKVQPQKQNYDEIKAIKDIKFHYRDKVDPITYVKNLCGNLHVSLERSVLGRSFPEFNANDITYILDRLTPESLNIQVVSPVFKTGVHNFIIDPIYGIQYAVEGFAPDSFSTWTGVQAGSGKFVLPGVNLFIPTNFALKALGDGLQSSASSEMPQVVLHNDITRVWHLQDTKYRIPKAFYGFFFKSNLIHSSPLAINQMTLFIKLYFDHINQLYYSGRLVSYSYNMVANKFGLELTVNGFNDKLDLYALALLRELANFKINETRYEILRDVQQNQLKTFSTWTIRNMLNFYLDLLITPNSWSYEELLSSYGEIDIDGITRLVGHVLSHSQIEILAHGNVTREEAIALSQKVVPLFVSQSSRPFCPVNPFVLIEANRDVQLPTDVLYDFTVFNEEQTNHGFLLYYQIGLEEIGLRSRLELFHQLIYSPFFNTIRTVQQLAYVTAVSFKYTYSGTLGLYILLQTSYAISHVQSQVEVFIDSVANILANMSKELFERNKKSLITRLAEVPKRMLWQSNRLWAEITTSQFLFDRNQLLADKVRSIEDMQEIVNFYKEYFQANGPKCRRMVIAIKSSKCKELLGMEETGNIAASANQCNAAPAAPEQQQNSQNQVPMSATSAQVSADGKQTPPAATTAAQDGSQSSAVQTQPAGEKINSGGNKPPECLPSSIMVSPTIVALSTADCSPKNEPLSFSLPQTQPPDQPPPTTAVSDAAQTDPPCIATKQPVSSFPRRVSIGNVRKFKCENTLWNIPKIITDNFI